MEGNYTRSWLLTWTTKGTWLPGDRRGWVRPPDNVYDKPPAAPDGALENWSYNQMNNPPVWLNKSQGQVVKGSVRETCRIQDWTLVGLAIMPNHVHVVVTIPGDPDPKGVLSRIKRYSSRALNDHSGKREWWTVSGSARKLPDLEAVRCAVHYVAEQPGALVIEVCPEF